MFGFGREGDAEGDSVAKVLDVIWREDVEGGGRGERGGKREENFPDV